jgi:hypothetical protein
MPSTLEVGTIYFDKSSKSIKVATSTSAADTFGYGVRSASYVENSSDGTKTLSITNESGSTITIRLDALAEKASTVLYGSTTDAKDVKSYYGLIAYIKDYFATEAAKKVYAADGSTVTQSSNTANGVTTTTFAVGTIAESQVSGLATDLSNINNSISSNTAAINTLNGSESTDGSVKKIVKGYVDEAVASTYKVKGSKDTIQEVVALTDMSIGDVWNVVNASETTLSDGSKLTSLAGSNFVYTKDGWDRLGGTISMEAYENIEQIQQRIQDAVLTRVGVKANGSTGVVTSLEWKPDTASSTDPDSTKGYVQYTLAKVAGATVLSDYSTAFVNSIGGAKGAVTVKSDNTAANTVNLSVSGQQLSATLNDISTLVWTEFN